MATGKRGVRIQYSGMPRADGIEAESGEDPPGGHLSCVVVEIGNLVAGLVAGIVEFVGEEAVELLNKLLFAAECLDEAGDVVRDVEAVLPEVGLGDEANPFPVLKGRDPGAVPVAPTRELRLGVDEVLQFAQGSE
nr:hypothetical protein [Edaphobacter aggregans]